jgi:hypothetical protein
MFRSKLVSVLSAAAVSAVAALVVQGGAVAQAAPLDPPPPPPPVTHPIKNFVTGKCLQPLGLSVSAPVVQEPCNGSAVQGWTFVQLATNHYRFRNQLSGLCLFSFIDPAASGNPMGLNTCRDVSNEEFNTGRTLPDIPPLEARTGFKDTGFCVDVPDGQPTDGLQMELRRCNGTLQQRWIVGFG